MKALVTGAAAGLGLALSRHLLGEGFLVAGVDRDRLALAQAAGEAGADFVPLSADLADTAALEGEITQWAAFGPFDLVFLNAGISAAGRFEDIDAEDHAEIIAVNAIAPMILASCLVRRGAINAGGTMAFISSLSHRTGYPGAASYAASKDALAVYASSVANPFARHGVHVLRVFPGPLRTDHAARHAPPGANAEARMDPTEAARIVIAAARARRKTVYPGYKAKLAAAAGVIAPHRVTDLMRRNIYEKFDTTS